MLRRLLILLTLGVFVYGTTLYPLWLWLELQQQGEVSMPVESSNSSLVAGNENGDMVIKVPIALPYHTDWQAPQEANGLIEVNGEFYTITAKDLRQDTLYIHCFRNQNAREIFGALTDFSQASADKSPQSSHSDPSPLSAQLLKLFKKDLSNHQVFGFGYESEVCVTAALPAFYYLNLYRSVLTEHTTPPPRI